MLSDTRSRLKSALKRHAGLDDDTITDYVLNLGTQGENAIRNELAEFPKEFVRETLEILQLKEKAAGRPSSSNIEAPVAHTSGADNHHVQPRKPDRQEIIACRQIPAFLQGENFTRESLVLDRSAKKAQWLQKVAQYTTARISEAVSASARGGHQINPIPLPTESNLESRSRHVKESDRFKLPIYKFREKIVQAVAENPVIVLVGDTGSGKTTQITQFLYDAGYSSTGKVIACTQPRRLAAVSVARRVASEMNAGKLGKLVGYSVRFDDCTSEETRVKYMTDGILLRELVTDPDLSAYSVIMLDEAHERTVATDVLFALLKSAVARRPDLRIVVTSATLDASKYGSYFGDAPVVRVPGRIFSVSIEWAEQPTLDYMEAALLTVKKIHESNPAEEEAGDILVFLTGQAEIDLAVAAIANAYPKGDLMPLPVYAAIPSELQSLIFDPPPPGKRKVVFATNIAETSLTIDGIKFVVDPGFAKNQVWDAEKGMGLLRVEAISQAQANQRSGRAGRTAPGICYRLYTKHSFDQEMRASALPEIQRENLGHVILLLKELGVQDLLSFDFMDPPPRNSLVSSMNDLYTLGAIDEIGKITDLGHSMASLPLDPALAKVFLTAKMKGGICMEDVLTILSMVSMPSVFHRPTQPAAKKAEADNAHRRLRDSTSDHMTLLKVYQSWKENKRSKTWCSKNYLQHKNLMKVDETRNQLLSIVGKKYKRSPANSVPLNWAERKTEVLKTLCAGFFQNVAKLGHGASGQGNSEYITLLTGIKVSIHPSSALYKQQSEYVLYGSLMLTSKQYMLVVSQIQSDWLLEAAPNVYQSVEIEDTKKRQRTEILTPLYQKSQRNGEWRVSQQRKLLTSRNFR